MIICNLNINAVLAVVLTARCVEHKYYIDEHRRLNEWAAENSIAKAPSP